MPKWNSKKILKEFENSFLKINSRFKLHKFEFSILNWHFKTKIWKIWNFSLSKSNFWLYFEELPDVYSRNSNFQSKNPSLAFLDNFWRKSNVQNKTQNLTRKDNNNTRKHGKKRGKHTVKVKLAKFPAKSVKTRGKYTFKVKLAKLPSKFVKTTCFDEFFK